VTYDHVTIYWLPSNGAITQCGRKAHAIKAGRTSRVQHKAWLRGGKARLHRNVGRLRLPGRVLQVSSEGWGCKLLVELIQPLVDLQDLICERPRHRKGCGRVAKGSRGLRVEVLNSGSSTRLYGMRLTAALYNGAVRGQPVDSHVIIVTHQ